MAQSEVNWFVIYTKPRWEKKVCKLLNDKDINVYCPLNKIVRQWSDRKKTILEPLFKGYVFVHISDKEKTIVREVAGVVNFVYWNGKPAVVRQEEIEVIQRFLSEFSEIEVEDIRLDVNKRVLIKNGVLVNYQGIILEMFGNKAKVLIESMGVKLSATINKTNLKVI